MKGCPGPGATGASTLLPMLTLSCFLQPKTPQRPQILISITALVRVSGLFSILENNLGFPHWKASLLPRAQWSKQTKKKTGDCSAAAQLGFVENGSVFTALRWLRDEFSTGHFGGLCVSGSLFSQSYTVNLGKEVYSSLRWGSETEGSHTIALRNRDVKIRLTCEKGLNQDSARPKVKFEAMSHHKEILFTIKQQSYKNIFIISLFG